jgi:hypothetical protein
MSVLIELLTLVVPKRELDARYPGGTSAFLDAAMELVLPPRFTCDGDAHLVNISFHDAEHLAPAVELLLPHGFGDTNDSRAANIASVDQHTGPTTSCDWLDWREHPDGYTHAWLAGTEPGELAAPEGWTAERSRHTTGTDAPNDNERLFPLGAEDGVERWLDLATGEQIEGDADAPSLLGIVCEALEVQDVMYKLGSEHRYVIFRLAGEHTTYDMLISANETTRIVVCYAAVANRVPAERRVALCELLARINYGLTLGSFDMDMNDGEVRCRTGIDVEGGALVKREQ